MHIPDGFLDTKTVLTTSVLSIASLGIAIRQLNNQISLRKIPLMGLAASFIFVSQMLNFPVIGGTSGHLVGSVLLAVLLGPHAAILVMTSVLIVQCFLFTDGGLLALGANVLNMAVVGSLAGYGIYRILFKLIPNERGRIVAVAFAAWCSTILAAMFCAGELAWSGTALWQTVFPAIVNIHIVIGAGEALITSIVLVAIYKTRPDLLEDTSSSKTSSRIWHFILYGVVLTIGLLLFVMPFVSNLPDGLESVASKLGFEHKALSRPLIQSLFPSNRIDEIGTFEKVTMLSVLIGAVLVFGFSYLLARLLIKNSKKLHNTTTE